MPLHLIMLQLLDNMGIARPEYDGRDADRFSQGHLAAVSECHHIGGKKSHTDEE